MRPNQEQVQHLVILFDGVCNLCHGAVRFFIKRDSERHLRFASLQSESGRRILEKFGLPNDYLSSVVFVEGENFYLDSTAFLKACRHLGFPWSAANVFLLIPRPIRDLIYKWIAGNRYRWFGKMDSCSLPDPAAADRFL
ncbi:MAG: thiol-disulfide oxidoreductase DCC family protein [Opitutae bacterium]|nr:thiol-disulfide oxidoreductase DCC family protein [Opitutae bacterium]